MAGNSANRLMALYPRIFFACHRRHYPDPSARAPLTHHQERIIGHLEAEEPTNLSRLARHMGVQASTMSINVERLVRKGLVRRERAPDDRRQIRLRLTPEGARLKEAETVLDEDLVEMMLANLAEAERGRALDGLEVLARAADVLVSRRYEGMTCSSDQETVIPCD
jgi:DNA-binding MarR family transcriptional regulator